MSNMQCLKKCTEISAKFPELCASRPKRGVLETWMKTKKRCTARFKEHNRTYLMRSLEVENCKDSADRLFTTWSSDGQRERRRAEKSPASSLQPARPRRISPIGISRITRSLKSGLVRLCCRRFWSYLQLSSSSSSLSGLHTVSSSGRASMCVFQMAVKRPHPPTVQSTPLRP